MRKAGKTYFLNAAEVEALWSNDLHPDRDAQKRREAFLTEIEETIRDLHIDEEGRICANPTELDMEALKAALKRREAKPTMAAHPDLHRSQRLS